MSRNADVPIPGSVVRRLTSYLTVVRDLCGGGVEWVSSTTLASLMGTTSSTVRQDLSYLEARGVSRLGYSTKRLSATLARVLGANSTWRLVFVGAGNLGRALACHGEFGRRGMRMVGVFDADRRKVGMRIGRLAVRPMRELGRVVRQRQVDIGVIAVPGRAAQGVTDLLVAAGVKGILNLSLARVRGPRWVPIVEVRMVSCLQELCHAMAEGRERARRKPAARA